MIVHLLCNGFKVEQGVAPEFRANTTTHHCQMKTTQHCQMKTTHHCQMKTFFAISVSHFPKYRGVGAAPSAIANFGDNATMSEGQAVVACRMVIPIFSSIVAVSMLQRNVLLAKKCGCRNV